MINTLLEISFTEDFELKESVLNEMKNEDFEDAFWSLISKTKLPEKFVDKYFDKMDLEELIEQGSITKKILLDHMNGVVEYLVADDDVMQSLVVMNNLMNELSETPVQEFSIPILEAIWKVRDTMLEELEEFGLGHEYIEEYNRRFDMVQNATLQSSIIHIANTEEMLEQRLVGYPLTVYLMTNSSSISIPLELIGYKEIPISEVMQVVSDFSGLIVTDPKARTRVFEFIARHNIANA